MLVKYLEAMWNTQEKGSVTAISEIIRDTLESFAMKTLAREDEGLNFGDCEDEEAAESFRRFGEKEI